MQITRDDVLEIEPHRFCAEASDLGLRAGEWPETMSTRMGNGQPFLRTAKKLNHEGDELWYVRYVQQYGCLTLIVYND